MQKLTEKTCSKCKTLKPTTEFHHYKTGKRAGKIWSECKDCRKQRLYKWRKDNPESYKEHYTKARVYFKYKLRSDDLVDLYKRQNSCCAICKEKKRLVIDHCHAANFVRGLLCYTCNTLLGHIENDSKMREVVEYLTKNKSPSWILRMDEDAS